MLYRLDGDRYEPTLICGDKKNFDGFSSSSIPPSIAKSGFSRIAPGSRKTLFNASCPENRLFSFAMRDGDKILFVLLKEACEIDDSLLLRLADSIGKISAYRERRFAAFPEAVQEKTLLLDRLSTEAGVSKSRHVVLFLIDMKPFAEHYRGLYGNLAAPGIARDAFSAIRTGIGATGSLFSLDGENALAVLYSKTAHDAQMLGGQVYSVFRKLSACQDRYRPDFGSFANFNLEDAESKQDLCDYIDTLQE